MNEAEQRVTKKRGLLTVRLVVYSLLIGTTAFLFGMNGIVQWDVSSGRSRNVTTMIGVPIWCGEPQPTTVSEWLGEPVGRGNWILVRGPQTSSQMAKVHHCDTRLLRRLPPLEAALTTVTGSNDNMDMNAFRRQIAAFLLDDLGRLSNICHVSRHLDEFYFQAIERFWHDDQALTPEALKDAWQSSNSWTNDIVWKPTAFE